MTNYVLNEEKMFADVADGVAIIINSETGIYYGLNKFSTNVYENIVNGASREDILSCLKSYKNCPNDIEISLDNFINRLLELNIINKSDKQTKEIYLSEDLANFNSFTFDLKEYSDAQELLLADPIHEVKEETGWSPEKESIGYTKEETLEREKKVE